MFPRQVSFVGGFKEAMIHFQLELLPVQAAELSDAIFIRNSPCPRCGGLTNRREKNERPSRGDRGCYRCRNYEAHLRDWYLGKAFRLHRAGLPIPPRIQSMIMPEGKGFAVRIGAELRARDLRIEDYDVDGPKGWCFSFAKPLRECPFNAPEHVKRQFLQSWYVRPKSEGGGRKDGR